MSTPPTLLMGHGSPLPLPLTVNTNSVTPNPNPNQEADVRHGAVTQTRWQMFSDVGHRYWFDLDVSQWRSRSSHVASLASDTDSQRHHSSAARLYCINRPVSRSAATITAQPRFRRICAGRGWNLEGRTSAARTYVPRTPAPGQHFIHSLHSFISPQNGSKNRIETGLN